MVIEGAGKVNWKGVAYYNRLIDYLLTRGITPYANLYHYDLPLALEKKYKGLLSPNVVYVFIRLCYIMVFYNSFVEKDNRLI